MAAENAAAVPPVPADPKHQLDPADNLAAFALVDETCYTLVYAYIYMCVFKQCIVDTYLYKHYIYIYIHTHPLTTYPVHIYIYITHVYTLHIT